MPYANISLIPTLDDTFLFVSNFEVTLLVVWSYSDPSEIKIMPTKVTWLIID